MKKLYSAFAVAFTLSYPAHATNWLDIGGNDSVAVKIDTDSVRRSGNRVKTWLKWEWTTPQPIGAAYLGKFYKEEKQLQVSDCANKTLAVAQGIQYSADGSGVVVNSYSFEERQWKFSEAAPETIGETIIGFACTIKPKK